MSAAVSLSLPEGLMKQAERWALLTGKPVEEFLTQTIKLSLQSLSPAPGIEKPVNELPDEVVLCLAQLQLDPSDDERLSELLHRQQAMLLTGNERQELTSLMHLYRVGLLRKAQALRIAVERGLMEPLNPSG